jgi:hypothetical protein
MKLRKFLKLVKDAETYFIYDLEGDLISVSKEKEDFKNWGNYKVLWCKPSANELLIKIEVKNYEGFNPYIKL